MSERRSFRVHHELVVHDVLDGEVLAIRNDTGTYYSLAGTAAEVWVALLDGHDEAGLVAVLGARHTSTDGEIAAAVASFLDQLAAESLIVPSDVTTDSAPPGASTSEPSPFVVPELQVFTDMQDLLLFDPIHEVSPAGWPHLADSPDTPSHDTPTHDATPSS